MCFYCSRECLLPNPILQMESRAFTLSYSVWVFSDNNTLSSLLAWREERVEASCLPLCWGLAAVGQFWDSVFTCSMNMLFPLANLPKCTCPSVLLVFFLE